MLLLQLLTVVLAAVLLIRSVNHDKRISNVEIRIKHLTKEIRGPKSMLGLTPEELCSKALTSMLEPEGTELNNEEPK